MSSLFLYTERKLAIIHQLSNKNRRLNELMGQIYDIQSYAANVGDGNLSMSDLMNTPGSMFSRSIYYMQYSHNAALSMSQQKFTEMQPMIAAQTQQMQDANQIAQYQAWVQQSLYKQAREYLGKQEARALNEQEKKLEKEKVQVESQIKMLENALKGAEAGENKSIERWKVNING